MRGTWLVFRRDYLGYVQAWGFWLGLLAVPLILVLSGSVGFLASSSSPVRYYALLDAEPGYAAALEERLNRPGAAAALRAAAAAADGEDVEEGELEGELSWLRVDAPARTLDGLRPFLLGEALVDGPGGPKPLFAVLIRDAETGRIDYWSDNVSVDELASAARYAARQIALEGALGEAGLDPGFVDRARAGAAPVVLQRVGGDVGADGEVTLADRAPYIVALGMALVLWFMVFSAVQYLLMGTIEERSNKIFDTLLTSVTLTQLLAGKLLAVLAVTLTMMLAWGGAAAGLGSFAGSAAPALGSALLPLVQAAGDPWLWVPAILSLVLGYLMYGALFMALGSLCDTIQEAQTLMSPMLIILMVPVVVAYTAMGNPDSPFLEAMSWVPVFTPFLLIMRMPLDPPAIEVALQLLLMAATTAAVMWLAARVYKAGAVHGAGVGDLWPAMKRAAGFKTPVREASESGF